MLNLVKINWRIEKLLIFIELIKLIKVQNISSDF